MPRTEAQKFQRHPVAHTLWRTLAVAQAIKPAARLADTESKRNEVAKLIDWGRVAIGGLALYKVAQGVMEEVGGLDGVMANAKAALTKGQDVHLGKTHMKLPGWSVAMLASGAAAALVGSVSYMEEKRNETALKEAPQEAQAVRSAYDKEVAERKVAHGIEVSGTQLLAQDYAGKFLHDVEGEKGVNKREVRKAIDDARTLVRSVFDPKFEDASMQEAIRLVAGDAFEAILLNKELPETAGVLTARPRDEVIKFLRELPERADKLPLLRWFTPDFIKKALKALAGDQALTVGNLNLDPRAFVGAGSEKTLTEVNGLLRKKFEEIIADEQSHDATGEHVARINGKLPTGLKVSDTQKDGKMNTILAAVFVQEHPELAPKVAEVVGVLDAIQNKPEIFGEQITSQLPSYRRRKGITK